MDKEALLKEIKVLKDDFTKNEHQQKSERDVCRVYIEPLFTKLGWNFRDLNEVKEQVSQADGRPDYIFYLNESVAFFLETKKVQELTEKDLKQAVNYGRSKNKRWAVLSNFKETIILICDIKETSILKHIFKRISYSELESSIDDLLLLSRESFESGVIEKKAQDAGRIKKTVKIDDELLNDILGWRQKLMNSIKKNSSKEYSREELEEIVQILLNRIIFIRTVEDRKHEARPDETIKAVLNQYDVDKSINIMGRLNKLFKEYDEIYDSKLFTYDETDNKKRHECERVEIDSPTYYKILKETYDKDEIYTYQFNDIDADVLGSMYEIYIGRIQSTRKEQGIYYTPKYVVDYIVQNTLGELLKTKKLADAEKIKVLDMACGSGSFLLGAFDTLDEYYKIHDKNYSQSKLDLETEAVKTTRKTRILKNNIYGVDLDPKAVEITELNLLLKAAETKHRLPDLRDNIKCGNSLIDDEAVAKDKVFKWQENFSDTIQYNEEEKLKEGYGFDVIIGNPPYVDIKQLDPSIVKYFFNLYSTVKNRMNLYSVFVERALTLLKEDGYFGFIIPNSILYNESYSKLRNLLLESTTLKKIIRLPDNIFEDAKVETIILIFQKKKNSKRDKCLVYIYPRTALITSISKNNCPQIILFNQNDWTNTGIFNISTSAHSSDLLKKIEHNTVKLIDLCDFSLGLTPYDKYRGHTQKQIEEKVFHSNSKKDASFKPLLNGENIVRYGIFWGGNYYISYGNWLGAPREKRFFVSPRIVVRQIISGKPARIYAGYTEEEFYNTQIAFNLVSKDKAISIKYILALLNSKLLNFYHREKYLDPSKNLFQKILIANAKQFPIKIGTPAEQRSVEELVTRIISLNKQLHEIGDKQTSRRQELEAEIDKTDAQIDELVYKIYGITEDEKKIIKESLK